MYTLRYLGEIWKPVKGWESLYEVSNFGRVRSFDRKVQTGIKNHQYRLVPSQFITLREDSKTGYVRVCLTRNNKSSQHYLHRLVAEAFIPNPNNLPCVNHKNEMKWDCRVENLEWCSYSYNVSYGTGTERRVETRRKRGTAKTDPKVIQGVSLIDGTVITYNSIRDAMKDGFYYAGHCCRGIKTQYKGYKWSYV